MVNYDPAKIYFITESTIDKILYESPIITQVVALGDPDTPTTINFTVPHTIGTPVIVNGMFSIDAVNYYPCALRVGGAYSPTFMESQFVFCDMFADGSNVTIYISNGFETQQTVSLYYVLESLS